MADWRAWPFPTGDPYPAYHAARGRAAVQRDERLGAVLVLSHEHALAVLRNPEQWSSNPRNSPALVEEFGGESLFAEPLGGSLLMSDPPDHTRLRSSVNRFFTPRAVQQIKGRVAAIVDSAFAPLSEGEPIELMSELAYPIPLAVIAELFDVGLEGAELLRAETPTLARALELDPTPAEIEAVGAAAMTVMLFLVPIIAERRTHPGEDLLSALIHPPDGGVSLRTEEIATMCLLLLAAGHETTSNLIGNGTLALLENPDQLEWLAAHPDRCAQAVEELVRYDSPAQVASRIALTDLEVGGVQVRKGQQALVVLGAANRDPACHPDPDRLRLGREGERHLAFGNGPHFCVGAGLARLEGQETFARLAQLGLRSDACEWSYGREPSRTFRRLRSLRLAPESANRTYVEKAALEAG
ncbi:MAG TPA: cytochrome P450 [Solirubrobacteraceae bacterium]|jgi:cytochrome P450|nr:cytochrome P450 [Solirubrobacteraceae bacterium]